MIEAVFEDTALKHKVFQEIQHIVAPDALLCSNTSTLPITAARRGRRAAAEDFIGLHFFSPVDKMPLVEIIKGERTGDEALARAFDLVRQINKTPIVVNDSRGFFTSRVIGHFINEGVAMVGEGIEPASVEQAAAQAGYPAKVLSLMDELTLTLPRKIRNETQAGRRGGGRHLAGRTPPTPSSTAWSTSSGAPGAAAARASTSTGGRQARPAVAGPARALHQGRAPRSRSRTCRSACSSPRRSTPCGCLEEGVLTSVADANIGSILGIGFPGWTGGVLQYINGYEGGLPGFVARARELAERYGERFTPPALLVEKAGEGRDLHRRGLTRAGHRVGRGHASRATPAPGPRGRRPGRGPDRPPRPGRAPDPREPSARAAAGPAVRAP